MLDGDAIVFHPAVLTVDQHLCLYMESVFG